MAEGREQAVPYNLHGHVAFITGSGMGIGRAIAEVFAESGCDIAIFDINQTAAEETAESIRQLGRRAISLNGDIRKYDDVERAAKECVKELGALDFAVANAGIARVGSVLAMEEEDFEKVVDVNMKGTFNTVKATAREMVRLNKGGRIVTISSANAVIPARFASAYCGSKAAINSMSRCWAQDLAPYGPGATDTALTISQLENDDAREGLLKAIPLARMAKPREVGHTAVFFCTDGAKYLTGTFLLLDGGLRDHNVGDAEELSAIRTARTSNATSGDSLLEQVEKDMNDMRENASKQRSKFGLQ